MAAAAPLHRRPGLRGALVRKAFLPFTPQPQLAYRHAGRWHETPPIVWDVSFGDDRLAVVVPTVTHGKVTSSLRSALRRVAVAVDVFSHAQYDVRCLVTVVAYETSTPSVRHTLTEEMERAWRDSASGVPWVGVSVTAPSKILAINSALPLLDINGVTAIAWFDDDVEVTPYCLRALWRAYDPAGARVYGARVEPADADGRANLVHAALARRSASGNAYPYGCSMLLSRATLGEGIPLVYMSDDHFFLLSLLDPGAENPLYRLPVVDDAIVRVMPPRTLWLAVRRVMRNYRNVQRVLADADQASARWFRRKLQFAALRPPLSVHEAATMTYWIRLGIDAGRAVLWSALVTEVLVRGLLGRPRRALWSSAPGR